MTAKMVFINMKLKEWKRKSGRNIKSILVIWYWNERRNNIWEFEGDCSRIGWNYQWWRADSDDQRSERT